MSISTKVCYFCLLWWKLPDVFQHNVLHFSQPLNPWMLSLHESTQKNKNVGQPLRNWLYTVVTMSMFPQWHALKPDPQHDDIRRDQAIRALLLWMGLSVLINETLYYWLAPSTMWRCGETAPSVTCRMSPHKRLNLPEPWFWTFQHPEPWMRKVCCL